MKLYGQDPNQGPERKYSPPICQGARKERVQGNPKRVHVSTSHVECNNLTMRMGMRRFTRLTNAFSKKLENHIHMLSLYFVHYNFCRQHKGIGEVSPAMAAGVSETLHGIEWIVGLIDARAPQPGPRGSYQKHISN